MQITQKIPGPMFGTILWLFSTISRPSSIEGTLKSGCWPLKTGGHWIQVKNREIYHRRSICLAVKARWPLDRGTRVDKFDSIFSSVRNQSPKSVD